MPSTEVPTSPPGRPPEPFTRRKRVRYEELDPDELLHLIDRLEDERSRALRREGIWISFIAHLLLFWFLFYGPKFRSHQPHVVNPNDNKKDLTYLNLPPDAQKQVKPKPQAPLSDKNRVAQIASSHARSQDPATTRGHAPRWTAAAGRAATGAPAACSACPARPRAAGAGSAGDSAAPATTLTAIAAQ